MSLIIYYILLLVLLFVLILLEQKKKIITKFFDWIKSKIYLFFFSKKKVSALIVGPPRSGTTFMCELLSKHDNILTPGNHELHFFSSDRYSKNYNKYHKFFGKYFFKKKNKKNLLLLEKTPQYIMSKKYLNNIYEYNSNIKIIYFVRDPIDRIISEFKWQTNNSMESRNFKDAILEEFKNYKSERNIEYDFYKYKDLNTISFNTRYIYGSDYKLHMKQLHSIFPKENILIVNLNKFKNELDKEFFKITNFLKIKKMDLDKINSSKNKGKNINLDKTDIHFVKNLLKNFF